MTCPSCSAPVRPLATVCTACWTDLDAATEPEPAQEIVLAAEPEPTAATAAPVPAAGRAGRRWSTPVEAWYAPAGPGERAPRSRRRR